MVFLLLWNGVSLTQESRGERGGRLLEGVCAAITPCSDVNNFSSNVQNLAVKPKHEGV